MKEELAHEIGKKMTEIYEEGIRAGLSLEIRALNGMADKDSDPVKAWVYRNAAKEIARCMDTIVYMLLEEKINKLNGE